MATTNPWDFLQEARNVGAPNNELVQLETPSDLTEGVIFTAEKADQDKLSPVVPNTAALDLCIAEVCDLAGDKPEPLKAMLVHVWERDYDLRCVFKCKSGSLFAAFLPNGTPNGDWPFVPGCTVEFTDFRAFNRVHTKTTIGCFLATEMIILACRVMEEALELDSLTNGEPLILDNDQLIFGFDHRSIKRAYLRGECVLEIDGPVLKDRIPSKHVLGKYFHEELGPHVPAVDVQVSHKEEDSDDGSDDTEEVGEGHEYSVTTWRLVTRREEDMRAALSNPQPAGCECLQKYGVVGCLVQHLPPEHVHAACSPAWHPNTLEVEPWELSRFYAWYSHVLQDPSVDSTREARATCMVTAVRGFGMAHRVQQA